MVASPLSSASCFISKSTTGIPALMRLMLMPPPIVPAPMMPTLRMGRVGRVVRHVENVRRRALRLEYMTQRRGLRRQHERGEQFAFPLDARIEGPIEGGGDRFHARDRCGIVAGNRLGGIARELEKGLVIRHVDLQIAHAPHAQFLGHDFARKGDGRIQQVTLRECVEQRRAAELFGRNGRHRRQSC